ncbi:MAG: DUF721 domain-containing protein [Puniceicoccaceae bacterium]
MKGFYRSEMRLINSFRGLMVKLDRGREDRAKPLGEAIGKILEGYPLKAESPETLLMENWESVVGKTFYRKCAPDRLLADGTLFIKTESPVIRQELKFGEKTLLKNLAKINAGQGVKRLVIR